MKKGWEIQVYGKVQGVWYRGNTQYKALSLKIVGWVRNEKDGTVLLRAFGDEKDLEILAAWCKEGPTHAQVEKIEIRNIPWEEHDSFIIQRR
jgi:acylphosphatase